MTINKINKVVKLSNSNSRRKYIKISNESLLTLVHMGDKDPRNVMTDKELAKQTSLLPAVLAVTNLYMYEQ